MLAGSTLPLLLGKAAGAFPPRPRGGLTITRERALLRRHGLSALSRNLALLVDVDQGKATPGQIERNTVALEDCSHGHAGQAHSGCDLAGAHAFVGIEAADLGLDLGRNLAAPHRGDPTPLRLRRLNPRQSRRPSTLEDA